MDYLGLTTLEVGDRGGPKRAALRAILNARRMPRRSTLAELDTVLGWPAGLAQDLLDEQCDVPAADEWLELPEENKLGLVRARLVQLRKEQYRISQTLEQHGHLIGELIDLIDEARDDE